jgi:hypothetical protein
MRSVDPDVPDARMSSTQEDSFVRLVIRRNQADVKGVLGGHRGVKFALSYQLVTTDSESAIIDRYRLGSHVVVSSGSGVETVDRLRAGVTQTLDSVSVLIANERVIKQACQEFGALMAVAKSFGGEDVVEIDTSLPGPAESLVATPQQR